MSRNKIQANTAIFGRLIDTIPRPDGVVDPLRGRPRWIATDPLNHDWLEYAKLENSLRFTTFIQASIWSFDRNLPSPRSFFVLFSTMTVHGFENANTRWKVGNRRLFIDTISRRFFGFNRGHAIIIRNLSAMSTSEVITQAHNLKAAGSNPAPATPPQEDFSSKKRMT